METACLVFLLISTFVCLEGINTLEYDDLVTMGINCPTSICCEAIDKADFTRRNCECDHGCAIYQDCCINAREREKSQIRKDSAFICTPFGRKPTIGAYVIETCPRNFNGAAELRQKCQNQNNITDLYMSVPVTDTVSKFSYKNRYCAECNNVDISGLQNWLVQMDCGFTSIDVNNSIGYKNLHYNFDLNKWNVDINDRSFTCDLKFDIPENLLNKIRLCRLNVISSCPRSWTQVKVKRDCESYTAIMYVTGSATMYKNPHCAICNGVTVDAMNCDPGVSSSRTKSFFHRTKTHRGKNLQKGKEMRKNAEKSETFPPLEPSDLFDDVRSEDITPMPNYICEPNQEYDPYIRMCRNIHRGRLSKEKKSDIRRERRNTEKNLEKKRETDRRKHFSLPLLLKAPEVEAETKKICGPSQIYDPFVKNCRKVIQKKRNLLLVGRKDIPVRTQ